MKKITTLLLGVTVVTLVLTACVPGLGTVNQDPGPIYTQAAQTIEATMTMGAMLNALTTQQAEQLEPTSTQAVIEEPTTTPLPEATATIEPTITYSVPMISATRVLPAAYCISSRVSTLISMIRSVSRWRMAVIRPPRRCLRRSMQKLPGSGGLSGASSTKKSPGWLGFEE